MNKDAIAKQNDLFRTTMICTNKHHVVLTEGVAESKDREEVITKVRNFNDFNEDNNPYGENDFGKVTVNKTNYYFKIDYYDQNFEYGEDPYVSPVSRAMTIMRTDEY